MNDAYACCRLSLRQAFRYRQTKRVNMTTPMNVQAIFAAFALENVLWSRNQPLTDSSTSGRSLVSEMLAHGFGQKVAGYLYALICFVPIESGQRRYQQVNPLLFKGPPRFLEL